jgi:hypothetical protein
MGACSLPANDEAKKIKALNANKSFLSPHIQSKFLFLQNTTPPYFLEFQKPQPTVI